MAERLSKEFPLTDAERKLVESHLWLVPIGLKKHPGLVRFLGLEHARSAAHLGLMIAARKYDPDFGTTFSTYAPYWIWSTLTKDARRAGLPRNGSESTPLPISLESSGDPEAKSNPPSIYPDEAASIRRAVAMLPAKYAQAVRRCWLDGEPVRVVGAEMGLTGSRVTQILSKAKLLLRRLLDNTPDGVVLRPQCGQNATNARLVRDILLIRPLGFHALMRRAKLNGSSASEALCYGGWFAKVNGQWTLTEAGREGLAPITEDMAA